MIRRRGFLRSSPDGLYKDACCLLVFGWSLWNLMWIDGCDDKNMDYEPPGSWLCIILRGGDLLSKSEWIFRDHHQVVWTKPTNFVWFSVYKERLICIYGGFYWFPAAFYLIFENILSKQRSSWQRDLALILGMTPSLQRKCCSISVRILFCVFLWKYKYASLLQRKCSLSKVFPLH